MAVHPPTQLMLYITHRSPCCMFCAMRDSVWVRLRALCHCALSSVFLHIFPFPPFSCPSTPPPQSLIHYILDSHVPQDRGTELSTTPWGAILAPPLSSPRLSSPLYCGAVAQVPAPGRAAYPLRPRSPSHLSSLTLVGPPSQAPPLLCASHVAPSTAAPSLRSQRPVEQFIPSVSVLSSQPSLHSKTTATGGWGTAGVPLRQYACHLSSPCYSHCDSLYSIMTSSPPKPYRSFADMSVKSRSDFSQRV